MNDICEIVGGDTPSKSHPEYYCKRGIAWITPKDLSISKSKFSSRGSEDITSDGYKNSSAKLMPRGTVLFSSRAPIGYISIATNEICTNQGFKSAVPGIAGTGYLYYFLQGKYALLNTKKRGTGTPHLDTTILNQQKLVVPSAKEQKRIVARIEELFSELDNGVETLKKTKQQLAVYRQSVLRAAFEGKYTEQWRKSQHKAIAVRD